MTIAEVIDRAVLRAYVSANDLVAACKNKKMYNGMVLHTQLSSRVGFIKLKAFYCMRINVVIIYVMSKCHNVKPYSNKLDDF